MLEGIKDTDSDGEGELTHRSWRKLERDLYKEGFREGAVKGQEESYQSGFDIGFAEGFKIGEAMGMYKGATSLGKQVNMPGDENEHLRMVHDRNERNRACILCETDNVDSLSLDGVIAEQRMKNWEITKGFTSVVKNVFSLYS